MPSAVDAERLLSASRAQLARLSIILDGLLADLDLDDWRARPVAGEWAPIEIVCHLRDEEVEDFGARLRVVLDGTGPFTPIDPQRWADERRYRDVDPQAAMTALRERRMTTVAFLGSIQYERLDSGIEHPRVGRLSGLDLLAAWVAHDRLHVAQLSSTLARLWAARWAPARADYAGPLPYAGPLSP